MRLLRPRKVFSLTFIPSPNNTGLPPLLPWEGSPEQHNERSTEEALAGAAVCVDASHSGEQPWWWRKIVQLRKV
jgi:hypothetical protein